MKSKQGGKPGHTFYEKAFVVVVTLQSQHFLYKFVEKKYAEREKPIR
jgi:hypothetical protein